MGDERQRSILIAVFVDKPVSIIIPETQMVQSIGHRVDRAFGIKSIDRSVVLNQVEPRFSSAFIIAMGNNPFVFVIFDNPISQDFYIRRRKLAIVGNPGGDDSVNNDLVHCISCFSTFFDL